VCPLGAARHENFPQRRGHALCDPVLRLSTSRAGRSDNRLSCDLCESHGQGRTPVGVICENAYRSIAMYAGVRRCLPVLDVWGVETRVINIGCEKERNEKQNAC
jgi:hypothetical protein